MDNNAGFRRPSPDDKFIDYNTFLMMFNHAISSGDMNLVTTDITAADQPLMAIAIVEKRTQQAGESGTIPPDTEVVMYKATEAKWDSKENEYVAVTEGMEFDGIDQNFLRLMGQPGFSNTPYNYDPLLSGAIVPIYRVPENAQYDSPGDVAANIKVFDWSWQIIYLGEDSIVHPFKASKEFDMAGDGMTIIVGAMRAFDSNAGDGTDTAATSHTGADLITIHQGDSAPKILVLDTPDSLVLENQAGDNVIIYYEIDLSSIEPTAELKDTLSNEWPPTDITEWENKLIVPVCYARIVETEVGEPFIETIGQTLLDHITFDGAGGGGGVAVRRSVQLIGAIIQFLNDIKIGNLGSAKALGYLYGGQDVLQDLARQYFPMWDEGSPQQSYLNPSSIPSTGGAGEELNKGEIRMNDLFNHTTEVYHGHFEDDSRINTETIQEVFLETVDPGGSTIKCRITKNMHIYPPGAHPGDPYKNKRLVNLVAENLDDIGSSGSLFDENLGQEVRTVDDLGANIDTQNTPINTFQYVATNGAGLGIQISAAGVGDHSIKPAVDLDISTYAAPKSGNDQNILLNLARFGFNTIISVTTTYVKTPFTQVTQTTDGENDMTSTLVFDAEPTDAIEFFITLAFLKNAGVYTRFDLLGEYKVEFKFTYQSDGTDVDIDGAGNSIITVNDSQFVLGTAIATTTPSIPGIRSDDNIVCEPTLIWFNNVNAQPAMFGETNYDLVNATSPVGGAVGYTHSVAAGSIDTPVVNHSSVNTGGVLAVPIDFEYEILEAAAATTDFSGDDTALILDIIRIGDNTPLDISISVPPGGGGGGFGDTFQEDIINPTNSNATDGLLFQLIAFLSEADIVQGADYKIRISTPGLLPAPVEFTFNLAETGIMFWSDGWGASSQDNPFELNDDFSGIGDNSKEVGDKNWNWRWSQQQGSQGDAVISNNQLEINPGSTWHIQNKHVRMFAAYQVRWGEYTRVNPVELKWNVTPGGHEVALSGAAGNLVVIYFGSSSGQGGGFNVGDSIYMDRADDFTKSCSYNGGQFAFTKIQTDQAPVVGLATNGTGSTNTTKGVTVQHKAQIAGGPFMDYIVPWPERWGLDTSGGRHYIVPGEPELTQEISTGANDAKCFISARFSVGGPNAEVGYREDGIGGLEVWVGWGTAASLPVIIALPRTEMATVVMRRSPWTYSDWGGSVGFPDQISSSLAILQSRWITSNIANDPEVILSDSELFVGVDSPAVQLEDVEYESRQQDFAFPGGDYLQQATFFVSNVSDSDPKGPNCTMKIRLNGNTDILLGWSTEHNGTFFSINGVPTAVDTHETGGKFVFKSERVSNTVNLYIDTNDAGFVLVHSQSKSGKVDDAAIRFGNDAGGAGNDASADFVMTDYIFTKAGVEYTEDFIIFEEIDDMDATEILTARRQDEISSGGELHEWSLFLATLNTSSNHVETINLFADGSGILGGGTWKLLAQYGTNNFNTGNARTIKIVKSEMESPTGTPYTTPEPP